VQGGEGDHGVRVPKMVRGKCALHEKRVRVQFFSRVYLAWADPNPSLCLHAPRRSIRYMQHYDNGGPRKGLCNFTFRLEAL